MEAEREAWREDFCAIQAGVGKVPNRVWDNIPQSARMPGTSHKEFERAVGQMQCGRAAWKNGFYLKYGGPGLEAENWPSEWRVGLVVPPWKRKR